jgi:methylmalonyl-CoA mutase
MSVTFPQVTLENWRAQVDKELAGASFEKALVHRTPEGLSVLPLYTELTPQARPGLDPGASPFRICMRAGAGSSEADLADDLGGGADAIWIQGADSGAVGRRERVLAQIDPARTFVVLDVGGESPEKAVARIADRAGRNAELGFALTTDPLAALARGESTPGAMTAARAALAEGARAGTQSFPRATTAMVSTLPYHDAGADAADEIAIALATGVAYLRTLMGAGFSADAGARQIALQVAVGRDTFAEVCKLRALRLGWKKVLAAAGATTVGRTTMHAVCSSRTLAQRDPWVNMLRVTTQVFAASLGGADLVTPASFDEAFGSPSALGRRVARNTGLVLREESHLGRVIDPGGGSYYFEALTDALAREAWTRFQSLEREGGVEAALASGRLQARLEAAWRARLELIVKRREPILGVSEFANLDEKLPRPATAPGGSNRAGANSALPVHRDAEPFEQLRLRAEALSPPPQASLVTLGPLAESRPRVGFAAGFFGAGGIRTRETTEDEPAVIACLCGSDERYAAEAVERTRRLKAAGCARVLLAGRPGALEAPLREAGIDGFLFVGCDAARMLSDLLDAFR